MTTPVVYERNTTTVLILLFCLLGLLLLLLFVYKKLNRDTNGEYTINNMVYKEGGVRDRVRGVALDLETRLGVQLWPRNDTDEDGEEMQDVHDEEREVEEGSSKGSDSDEEYQEENGEEEGGDDTSDDNSNSENSEAGETTRLTDQPVATREEREDKEVKGEASGGAGLLVDLTQFSGGATWSEDDVCKEGDVTAL